MSRHLIEKYRQRLELETGVIANPWGGRLSVALVYPNTYHQGMSNLGLQTVYQMLNSRDDTLCERFFLPDPEDLDEHRRTGFPLVSVESQRPLADFDLVAFSISFENDYLNLPALFQLGRLPLWREERNERHPLVLCGGVCAFLNPEPLADIMDIFAVGEAEVILPQLMEGLLDPDTNGRKELLNRLLQLPGVYQPGGYVLSYEETGELQEMAPCGNLPQHVERQWQSNLDDSQSSTCVATPDTEFGSMHLVEVSRGCPRACRFCAAGFIYRPFREHSLDHLRHEILDEEKPVGRIGLVAAAVSDYGELADIGREIIEHGGEVSVSSVRIDAITEDQVSVLAEAGHKTLALAPEAGSQRMRDVINKGIDEEQILAAVKLLAEGGIPNLKLYFMIGLPTESDIDVIAIADLTVKIRQVWEAIGKQRGRLGRLHLSVNPFVPKPWTPLQWAPMERRGQLEKKYRLLQKRLRPLPNVELNFESLRQAEIQGFFARGDRRVGRTLPLLAEGSSLKAACRQVGLDPAFYLHRERGADELFPWDIIEQGVQREHLREEYEQASAAQLGYICHPGCSRCGLEC
ncbi:MAG: radical SAM protein [Deltaproteobacteria bacterium]|nr:radical SAM protein [Deltaproteobacteria bacterium]